MTSLDAAYAYADIPASGLGESAQRVLMALMWLVLLQMLLLPSPLLTLLTGYAEPGGGVPLFKIHFYTYTLALAFAFVVAGAGLVRFMSQQIAERPGVIQFAAVVCFCAVITLSRQGMGGVAYMADTLLAAPLAVMLAMSLDEERRRRLTAFIIYFVTFNAIIGIVERIAGLNLLFVDLNDALHFRATALLGHPLENAFVTSSMMFVAVAMPWPAWRKFLVLSICMAGILAFGARSSFAVTILLGITATVFFGTRALLRGDMRFSTLVAAPWIALVAFVAGTALTLGTVLGERIVKLAKFDQSAQARVDTFKVFDYLGPNELLYGVDFAELNFMLDINNDVKIIENCWIAILLLLGAVLFVLFAVSLLGFLRSIARGRGAVAGFAVLSFLIVASTSNSLSTKSPSLALFAVAMVGIPLVARRRDAPNDGRAVRYTPPLRDGAWS
ncbi:MAG: VpsF family polysaccharide biosynthesis protein [Methyloceanibacter sp.]|uniref:VpsF family polysaccharide biosynthesis protein n=1 Tax=Methyloceanibacter sp. TaxID=1965321 RepID=UPI003D6D79AD